MKSESKGNKNNESTACKVCLIRMPKKTEDLDYPICSACWQQAGDELERHMKAQPDSAISSITIDWNIPSN